MYQALCTEIGTGCARKCLSKRNGNRDVCMHKGNYRREMWGEVGGTTYHERGADSGKRVRYGHKGIIDEKKYLSY